MAGLDGPGSGRSGRAWFDPRRLTHWAGAPGAVAWQACQWGHGGSLAARHCPLAQETLPACLPCQRARVTAAGVLAWRPWANAGHRDRHSASDLSPVTSTLILEECWINSQDHSAQADAHRLPYCASSVRAARTEGQGKVILLIADLLQAKWPASTRNWRRAKVVVLGAATSSHGAQFICFLLGAKHCATQVCIQPTMKAYK